MYHGIKSKPNEDEEEEEGPKEPNSYLYDLIKGQHQTQWEHVCARVKSHPKECKYRDFKNGSSPLIKAITAKASLEVTRLICDADPAAIVSQNNSGRIALYYAIGCNDLNVFEYLLDRSQVPLKEELAIMLGLPLDLCSYFIIPFLGNPIMSHDNESWSLLHCLVMRNAPVSQISLFIQSLRSELLMSVSRYGSTPLHEACRSGSHDDTIAYLIKACPQSVSIPMRDGNMPLHLACKYGLSLQLVKRLYDVFPRAISHQNEHGFTPLHSVCWSEHATTEVVQFLVDSFPNAKIVTTGPGRYGYTPIQIVISSDVNHRNNNLVHLLT